jgi:hypothetical protein
MLFNKDNSQRAKFAQLVIIAAMAWPAARWPQEINRLIHRICGQMQGGSEATGYQSRA